MSVEKFRFHPAAALEFSEAADWHAERREGLGAEFVASARAKLASILDVPKRWPLVRGVRRVLVGKFPYAIVYRVRQPGEIQIVAIAHLKRKPRYWSHR